MKKTKPRKVKPRVKKVRTRQHDWDRRIRQWLVGFTLLARESDRTVIPCWRDETKPGKQAWMQYGDHIRSWRFNWYMRVWIEYDHGDGKPYIDSAEFEVDNVLIGELQEAMRENLARLKLSGNHKFVKEAGWDARILPDARMLKNKRKLTIDRLQELLDKELRQPAAVTPA